MAGSVLKLTIDRQNRKVVAFRGSVGSIPDLFQSNVVTLQVQVVDPAATSLQDPTIVDLNGYGLRASVGEKPTGSSGGPAPLALQDTFTWDATNKWFTADLALNTTGIDGQIGAADFAQAWFELNLTLAGARITILQQTFTLRAVVDEGTSTVPTPEDVFLTSSETRSEFVPRQMENGGTITIPSPSGVYALELGCNDDGTMKANIITL